MAAIQPPQCMQTDDPQAADPARRRLSSKRSLLSLFKLKSHPHHRQQDTADQPTLHVASLTGTEPPENDSDFIDLNGSDVIPDDNTRDQYRWAIIFENQRGVTLFSTAYYSPLSLLPFDPPAFTLPEANPENRIFTSKTHQPTLTLATYPLPDGNWRWVSKTWMVDMRSDAQVQYDGYEYNWLFRKHKWHSDIGSASAGAWVRRRRWVRLMVKPAKPILAKPHTPSRSTTPSSTPALSHTPWRHSAAPSSHPPSFLDSIAETSPQDPLLIWEGVPEDDWFRCHDYLKTLSSDGRKLEIWKVWFGLADRGQPRKKQWSQDDELLPSENLRADNLTSEGGVPSPIDFVVAVVQDHLRDILRTFVYPDSRAQFLLILDRAGVSVDLASAMSAADSTQSLNFWSYVPNPSDEKLKFVGTS